MDFDVTAETREVTMTKMYITLNGNEFEAPRFIDFLEKLRDTDGFMSGLRSVRGPDEEIAVALQDLDLVGFTHSAGWFAKDKEALGELWEKAMVLYHDDLEEGDLSYDKWG